MLLLLGNIPCKGGWEMVKGISRQVIVVHAPEPKLFEQAIFILKENATQASQVSSVQ